MSGGEQERGIRRLAGWLLGSNRSTARRDDAEFALYRGIVSAARQPLFYAEWGVPDTTDGRREMIGLHAILVMRRLRAAGPAGTRLNQSLFDLMFADVDRNLREEGIGDLSVGKHVKRAASTFLARFEALDGALDHNDGLALKEVLQRNLYTSGSPPNEAQLRYLADHLRELDRRLAELPVDTILTGVCDLPELLLPVARTEVGGQNH